MNEAKGARLKGETGRMESWNIGRLVGALPTIPSFQQPATWFYYELLTKER
jgi:hypothetical protein